MAPLLAMLAAGGKAAAGLGIHGADHLALDDLNLLVAHGDIRLRNGGQQSLGVGMHRLCEQLVGTGELQALAKVHNHDVIRDVLDNAQVMGHEHIGQAHVILQVHQQVEDLCLN